MSTAIAAIDHRARSGFACCQPTACGPRTVLTHRRFTIRAPEVFGVAVESKTYTRQRRHVASRISAADASVATPLALAAALVPAAIFYVGAQRGGGSPCSPIAALKTLTENRNAILVDIRSKEGRSAGGSPDLKAARGTVVQVPYLKVSSRPGTADGLDIGHGA